MFREYSSDAQGRFLRPLLTVVLSKFAHEYEPPEAAEGFDKMYVMQPREMPDLTYDDVHTTLDAIRQSTIPSDSQNGTLHEAPTMNHNPNTACEGACGNTDTVSSPPR